MQFLRERLTIFLIALLPFHAFAVTLGSKVVQGTAGKPLMAFAMWKECVVALILLIAALEIIRGLFRREKFFTLFKSDMIDWIIVALLLISLFVTGVTHADWKLYLYGFRYDFVPLIAFLVLRRVAWSDWFRETIETVLITIGVIVAALGFIILFLPMNMLTLLGYSDLHSLYVADGAVAPYQQIGGIDLRRMQSTFSGPNRLGFWLLIPFSFLFLDVLFCRMPKGTMFAKLSRYFSVSEQKKSCVPIAFLSLFVLALLLTFSRSGWIAATIIILLAVVRYCDPKRIRKIYVRLGACVFFFVCLGMLLVPDIFVRIASTKEHFHRPYEAVQSMIQHPLGQGLGIAGPASNHVSDTCVILLPDGDPSWADSHPELCIFILDKQIRPLDRDCNCPVAPENWYLQIGMEMGWIGMLLYLVLIALILRRLYTAEKQTLAEGIFAAFVGLSIAGMLLHVWEDAAVAYTVWILAAATVSLRMRQEEEVERD